MYHKGPTVEKVKAYVKQAGWDQDNKQTTQRGLLRNVWKDTTNKTGISNICSINILTYCLISGSLPLKDLWLKQSSMDKLPFLQNSIKGPRQKLES